MRILQFLKGFFHLPLGRKPEQAIVSRASPHGGISGTLSIVSLQITSNRQNSGVKSRVELVMFYFLLWL
jgi:hypothetical protein